MSSKILFVFEGARTEKRISRSICNNFLSTGGVVVECVYGTDIYQLCQDIEKDRDQDIFNVIQERDPEALKEYKRKDFAEIYLFFDYDGHATKADDKKIERLLGVFDNETDNGKLYVSYPMVEAIKHIKEESAFENLAVCCNQNIQYKKQVETECSMYKDYRRYDIKVWCELLRLHLCKSNCIVAGCFTLPEQIIPQELIFQNQLSRYILPTATVSVLSAFPLFIHDYFGNVRTKEIILSEEGDSYM